MCRIAFEYVGLKAADHIGIWPDLFRPAEGDILLGDATKAKQTFGWEAEISLETMIHEMVDVDLERVRRNMK